MNEEPGNQNDLIETTDCLEAISVFRGWRNAFFVVVLICLLLIQVAFWLVDRNVVRANGGTVPAGGANTVAPDVNDAGEPQDAGQGYPGRLFKKLDIGHLARTVELVNGVLLVTAVLYTMAVFFCLMVSMVGRLGGIRHVSRAFFLSVVVLVLLIPWQSLLASRLPGVVYTIPELHRWMAVKDESLLNAIVYYLRFSAYWLLVGLLLIVAQARSTRWSKSILRRLEII